jgi:hypothetical protein
VMKLIPPWKQVLDWHCQLNDRYPISWDFP